MILIYLWQFLIAMMIDCCIMKANPQQLEIAICIIPIDNIPNPTVSTHSLPFYLSIYRFSIFNSFSPGISAPSLQLSLINVSPHSPSLTVALRRFLSPSTTSPSAPVVLMAGQSTPADVLELVQSIVASATNAAGEGGRCSVFKKDGADLVRRIALLTHFLEEMKEFGPLDWCSDLIVALQTAVRLLSVALGFNSVDCSVRSHILYVFFTSFFFPPRWTRKHCHYSAALTYLALISDHSSSSDAWKIYHVNKWNS